MIHDGQLIPNNSIISLESIGDYNDTSTSPLLCVTSLPSCCDTNRSGNWFPPGGGSPLDSDPDSPGLYQDWEDDQSIQLHRPSAVESAEEGLYFCEVPDENHVMQRLYVGVYSSLSEGETNLCMHSSYPRSAANNIYKPCSSFVVSYLQRKIKFHDDCCYRCCCCCCCIGTVIKILLAI